MDIEEAKYKSKKVIEIFDGFGDTESYDYMTAVETVLDELEKNETEYHDLAGEIHRLETELKEAKGNEYSANSSISDLLDEMKKKDKIIDEMAEQLAGLAICDAETGDIIILADKKEEVIKYYERKVENGD